MSSSSLSSVPRIQVFRPTMEEFKNFSKYIEKMESMGAHKAGLAKIIPPEGWCPRKGGYDDIDLMIPAPISQIVTGGQGLYQQYNVQQKALHVKEFQKLAESSKYRTPPHFDYEDLERKYWKNITFNSPIYGADVSGSLYDDGVNEFNIQNLNTILDMVKEDYEIQIEGVNTAYLYFGMWKTTFAWHTEDMDLYSINYLHFGAPKSWYVVPPEHGRRLERLAAGFFHDSHQNCGAFLRHKMTVISPHILKKYSIPCSKITQEPGEFMITFPFGYHSGFNHGFNCAESTNFALERWIEYGKRSSQCTCRNDCVKICMDVFVRKFQPERYDLWKSGKDIGAHPEEPNKQYAAPPPNKLELSISVKKEEKKKKVTQKIKRHPVSKLEKPEKKQNKDDIFSTTDDDLEKTDEMKIARKRKAKKNTVKKNDIKKVKGTLDDKLDIDESTQILDLKSEDVENPPELRPFWHLEEEKMRQKLKIKEELVCTSEENKVLKNNVQSDILNKFPKLKKAVDNWSLSVKLIDDDDETMIMSNDYIETEEKQGNITSSSNLCEINFSNSIYSQNWRCEAVSDGLKIKFVSPKHNQKNSLQTLTAFPKITSVGECSVTYKVEEQITDVKSEENLPESKADTKDTCDLKKECSPKVKRADHTKDSWAHPLNCLWQHEEYNFEAERKYNQLLASISPHCAICVIFTPLLKCDTFPTEPSIVPDCSPVKMPAFCYSNSLSDECLLDSNSMLKSDGTCPLLTCTVCKVCVHAFCYGVLSLPTDVWLCNRCVKETYKAECCLCVLRGGALKPTSDGKWAHITCAILITETYFENVRLRKPINVSKITTNRYRLKCKYCMKSHAHKEHTGVCIQCLSGRCYLPFHVTCGYMAGVIFEACDWPEPIKIICTKHTGNRRKSVVRHFTNVSVGESVIAKHENRRYYWAGVKQKYIQEYYSILFEDNSHSTNTLPEDIISKDVSLHGPPEINEKVQVKWTDNKVYNGIFKGSQSVELYVVEFDDGSVQHQERKEIYAADEQLPKEVQSKMSHSSESKSLDIRDIDGKRVRRVNQKYYSL